MSFGVDEKKKHREPPREGFAIRPLEQARMGEVVEFLKAPTVRNGVGVWVPAPSTEAEVVYLVGGSPMVRFVTDGGKTRPLWVGAKQPILSESEARARREARAKKAKAT